MSVDGKGPRYQPAADRVKVGEECCTVCLVASLFFDPPPIYCTSCGKRIQRQKTYYTMGQGESKVCVCTKCFTDMRGDIMVLEGVAPISRARLEKKQNNDEADEGVRRGEGRVGGICGGTQVLWACPRNGGRSRLGLGNTL